MQKAHSRINWENLPSINTPLGANNLNKMDKALDVIDDRVLSLYGYEGRVAQSEKNAKASETNAKTSETNAKQSELKAKEYMENAFSGTPEGYEKLVEDVRLMDIKTTTDTTLANSKAGGYKLLSMSGNSVQNGTPTPDAPQSIHNVGDCVEMIQGYYNASTGLVYSPTSICNKNPIPCKSGDVIKIDFETNKNIRIFYYLNGAYVTNAMENDVKTFSATVPSGVDSFNFYATSDDNSTTLDTVGKITLTINGKYVVQIVELGEDVAQNISKTDGYIDSTGAFVSFDGWCYKIVEINSRYDYLISNGAMGNSPKHCWYDSNMVFISYFATSNNDIVATPPSNAKYLGITFPSSKNPSVQMQKVVTVLLNEPLRDTDVMSNKEIVRNRIKFVYDGSSDEYWQSSSVLVGRYIIATNKPIKVGAFVNGLCSQAILGSETTEVNRSYITATAQFVINTNFSTLDEWKAHLQANPLEVECELATPTIEELDTDSQIALNSLETFNGVTYINVDSRVKPSEIKGEYGTSKVGARTIKNELRNDTLEIKYNELAVALVATESGV